MMNGKLRTALWSSAAAVVGATLAAGGFWISYGERREVAGEKKAEVRVGFQDLKDRFETHEGEAREKIREFETVKGEVQVLKVAVDGLRSDVQDVVAQQKETNALLVRFLETHYREAHGSLPPR